MDENDVRTVYLAVKEHIYQLVSERVRGKVCVWYDTRNETFSVQIKNGEYEFTRDIRNAWDLIINTGVVDKEVKELLGSYKTSITNYYFK